ncbi:MAG: hypothetical protein IT210_15370 [Armatimonadetes bacterium]|nr:hypothetical protein [Armatimonadota bacterium]
MARIIDTFPVFDGIREKISTLPPDEQPDLWLEAYRSAWPELADKQTSSYAEEGFDWRAAAKEHVFPYLKDRMADMAEARRNLLGNVGNIYTRAQAALGFSFNAAFVIHVGIGCGAGWADTFDGKPACLLGLEHIAECGWSGPEASSALVAHQWGHLFHSHARREAGLAGGSGPFWCGQHQAWLAREFLKRAERDESVRPFFGSWLNIEGKRQCGYYKDTLIAMAARRLKGA